MRVPKAVEPLEKDIQRQILNYLALLRIPCYRNNTGAAKLPGRGGRPQLVRFGVKGMPDILGILPRPRAGVLLAIEVKRPSGRLTEQQKETIDRLQDAGALAFVARSVEDVATALIAEGVFG